MKKVVLALVLVNLLNLTSYAACTGVVSLSHGLKNALYINSTSLPMTTQGGEGNSEERGPIQPLPVASQQANIIASKYGNDYLWGDYKGRPYVLIPGLDALKFVTTTSSAPQGGDMCCMHINFADNNDKVDWPDIQDNVAISKVIGNKRIRVEIRGYLNEDTHTTGAIDITEIEVNKI